MIRKYFLFAFTFIIMGCCVAQQQPSKDAVYLDSLIMNGQDSIRQLICTIKTNDGKVRMFYQHRIEGSLLISKLEGEEEDLQKHWIRLPYDRYGDGFDFFEDGFPDPIYYALSPDKKNLYVAGSIHANSNGWTTDYQLYKIDCLSLEAEKIVESAAIKISDDGITIAECRCINYGTAQCTADEIWRIHDEKLDWNGKVISVDSKEYDYKELSRRYSAPDNEYFYLRGFKPCVKDSTNY